MSQPGPANLQAQSDAALKALFESLTPEMQVSLLNTINAEQPLGSVVSATSLATGILVLTHLLRCRSHHLPGLVPANMVPAQAGRSRYTRYDLIIVSTVHVHLLALGLDGCAASWVPRPDAVCRELGWEQPPAMGLLPRPVPQPRSPAALGSNAVSIWAHRGARTHRIPPSRSRGWLETIGGYGGARVCTGGGAESC